MSDAAKPKDDDDAAKSGKRAKPEQAKNGKKRGRTADSDRVRSPKTLEPLPDYSNSAQAVEPPPDDDD